MVMAWLKIYKRIEEVKSVWYGHDWTFYMKKMYNGIAAKCTYISLEDTQDVDEGKVKDEDWNTGQQKGD